MHVTLLDASSDEGQHPYHLLQAAQNDLNATPRFQHSSLGQIQRWIGQKNVIEVLFLCRYEDCTGDGRRGKGVGKYEAFESAFVSHAAAEVSLAARLTKYVF